MVEMKPGRWKTRGKGVATVYARSLRGDYPWIGDSGGESHEWTDEGTFYTDETEADNDLIRYLGPLESSDSTAAATPLTPTEEEKQFWDQRVAAYERNPDAHPAMICDYANKMLAERRKTFA
jgi:hypothetical protein